MIWWWWPFPQHLLCSLLGSRYYGCAGFRHLYGYVSGLNVQFWILLFSCMLISAFSRIFSSVFSLIICYVFSCVQSCVESYVQSCVCEAIMFGLISPKVGFTIKDYSAWYETSGWMLTKQTACEWWQIISTSRMQICYWATKQLYSFSTGYSALH